ncbi:hypothetical protein [Clostridium estertheticum]|uniref:hypothetical protein n=1 Tax=Clostridium estertheticum TaxID=238834 RepID=UPI001C0D2D72|nr:hypothetical protein [Clostridium estertheticum]MBU3073876.1 hypothetical protein [Clostridium estertheticum]MBU3163971.1 hypothetical protein [Clostridium estertheticum]
MKWIEVNADIYKIDSDKIVEIENNNDLGILLKLYAEKFKLSAYKLTEYLLKSDSISNLDNYFFAVAYLFRHSIELMLKAIAFKYIINLEDRSELLKRTKHNLYNLLLEIKPYVESDIKVDEASFCWLLELFNDINDIDTESDSFRYPFGISAKKDWIGNKIYSIHPVFTEQTHIDLFKFGNKMIIAYEVLDSLYNKCYGKYKINEEIKPIFLEEGGSYYGQSVVGYKYKSEEYYPYVMAYTNSAKYLYKLISNDDTLKNSLFIPMCYLYRNAVEISLKETLFEECSFELQEALKLMNKKKHKILGLWNLIKDEIEEHANPAKGDKTSENAFKYIQQLNSIDGGADLFRYPFSKCLNVYFKRKRKFDVENVNNFFEELLSFLSGINGMMSADNEIMSEIKAEWEADMRAETISNYDDDY